MEIRIHQSRHGNEEMAFQTVLFTDTHTFTI
jgi:hypothetical protein